MDANCKNCCTKFCTAAGKNDDPDICEEYSPIRTNADRIRSMTDEELAKELLDYFAAFYDVEWTVDMLLEWLKQEASE